MADTEPRAAMSGVFLLVHLHSLMCRPLVLQAWQTSGNVGRAERIRYGHTRLTTVAPNAISY